MPNALCLALLVALVRSMLASEDATPITNAYGDGLSAFKAVLDQLMETKAVEFTPVQLTAWVTQLQEDVKAMDGSFASASQKLEVENSRLSELFTQLAPRMGVIQKDVDAKTQAVKDAEVNVLTAKNPVLKAVANRQLAAAIFTLHDAQKQAAATRALLAQTKTRLTVTAEILASAKAVTGHLAGTVGSGKIKEFVADMQKLLVSSNGLLEPLNHISRQLSAQNAGVELTKLPELTTAHKAQIKANLHILEAYLA